MRGHAGKVVRLTDDEMEAIIYELKQLWPECQIVHGRPRHSPSQGSVERLNRQFEQKISHWMRDNPSQDPARPGWSIGCYLVRWRIMTNYSKAIDDTPYYLLYGQRPRVGISALPLAPELLSTLQTEADLNRALQITEEATVEESVLQASMVDELVANILGKAQNPSKVTVSTLRAQIAVAVPPQFRDCITEAQQWNDKYKAVVTASFTAWMERRAEAQGDDVVEMVTQELAAAAAPTAAAPDAATVTNAATVTAAAAVTTDDADAAATVTAVPHANAIGPPTPEDDSGTYTRGCDARQSGITHPPSPISRMAFEDGQELNEAWHAIGGYDSGQTLELGVDGLVKLLSNHPNFVHRAAASDPSMFFGDVKEMVLAAVQKIVSMAATVGGVESTEPSLSAATQGPPSKRPAVSPGRAASRAAAGDALARQAKRMKKAAERGNSGSSFKVGDVVQVAVDDVDRARTDDPNVTLVVVEELAHGEDGSRYRLACKAGVLKDKYHPSYMKAVPGITPVLMGLDQVLEDWRSLPQEITLRAATRSQSLVGGQGMITCACKGKCDTLTCSCRKARRECTSRCHKGNKNCRNCAKH